MAPSEFSQAQRTIYLITRFIDGTIDFAELQELDSWRKESPEKESLFQELTNPEMQEHAIKKMQRYDTAGSFDKIKQIIQDNDKQRKVISMRWLKILAAATTLAVASILLFTYEFHKSTNSIVSLKPHPQYIAPGSDKAILTLANGKKIIINQRGTGIVAVQAGVQINNTIDGKIIYTEANQLTQNMIEFNTIETPKAGKYQLQLPDGTKVWLNADTKLHYPIAFKGKERNVELMGEAYFEVAKDKTKPFSVFSNGQKVTVLGTHFNINSYKDEGHIATTLVEGSVQVSFGNSKEILKPGQQSSLRNGEIKVSKADIHLAIAWKDGQLAFLRTDLKSVLRQIARWYDIEVEYVGKVPDFTISGDVSRDADLSSMLEILKLYDVHFIQHGRKLIITE
jgi:transmembrane sensor